MKKQQEISKPMQEPSVSTCRLSPAKFVKESFSYVKVREIQEQDLRKGLFVIIQKAKQLEGITSDLTKLVVDDIIRYISDNGRNLSLQEIDKALTLNRSGDFSPRVNHYNKFNVPFLSQVIDSYRQWKKEIRTVNKIEKQEERLLLTELTESQERDILRGGVKRCYNTFLNTGSVPPGSLHLYEALYDWGYLPTDKEEKLKVFAVAKRRVQESLRAQNPKNFAQRLEIKDKINRLKNGDKTLVIAEAYRISLHRFFTQISESNITLEKFLKW